MILYIKKKVLTSLLYDRSVEFLLTTISAYHSITFVMMTISNIGQVLIVYLSISRLHVKHTCRQSEDRHDHFQGMAGTEPAVFLEYVLQHRGWPSWKKQKKPFRNLQHIDRVSQVLIIYRKKRRKNGRFKDLLCASSIIWISP